MDRWTTWILDIYNFCLTWHRNVEGANGWFSLSNIRIDQSHLFLATRVFAWTMRFDLHLIYIFLHLWSDLPCAWEHKRKSLRRKSSAQFKVVGWKSVAFRRVKPTAFGAFFWGFYGACVCKQGLECPQRIGIFVRRKERWAEGRFWRATAVVQRPCVLWAFLYCTSFSFAL